MPFQGHGITAAGVLTAPRLSETRKAQAQGYYCTPLQLDAHESFDCSSELEDHGEPLLSWTESMVSPAVSVALFLQLKQSKRCITEEMKDQRGVTWI